MARRRCVYPGVEYGEHYSSLNMNVRSGNHARKSAIFFEKLADVNDEKNSRTDNTVTRYKYSPHFSFLPFIGKKIITIRAAAIPQKWIAEPEEKGK